MLEGSVEVSLLLQLHHRVKMLVVDVSVNPEQTLQDGFGHRHEVLWKRDSCGKKLKRHEKSFSNNIVLRIKVCLLLAF